MHAGLLASVLGNNTHETWLKEGWAEGGSWNLKTSFQALREALGLAGWSGCPALRQGSLLPKHCLAVSLEVDTFEEDVALGQAIPGAGLSWSQQQPLLEW